MSGWPGNPVASMDVRSFEGGTSSSIKVFSVAAQHSVTDTQLDFRIAIAFHDHPWWDNGRAYFSARLEKQSANGWVQEDFQARVLGDDEHDGDWLDFLTVSSTMTSTVEQYRIVLHCETRDTTAGTSADRTAMLQAVQGEAAIGDFTLDFVPISIVYCPPGQDMTASLTQSESYGTRFTIGQSSGMESQSGEQLKVDFLGLVGEGIGFSDSQSITNQSTSGVQVSHFRSTVVTADNQKAIGRAYWGPLGDIFVILVNPSFAASRRADGTILYALKHIEQVLVIPAYRLLRPDGDPIAGAVPDDVRRRLLELDPFLRNLDRFFPDTGQDLTIAANPFTNPSRNNRAELIGRWWLDTGTELNYTLSDSQQLFSRSANEVKFSSTVTINATAGAAYNGLSAALTLSQSNTTSVGFQTSKETESALAKTASCFLIHNQNERDLDGIEIYYDKVFSTFMFRRILARRRPDADLCAGVVQGRVLSVDGSPLRRMPISLTDAGRLVQETMTTIGGEYSFPNLCSGRYMLTAGDRRAEVVIPDASTPMLPVVIEMDRVRRVLDLSTASVWEVSETLGLSSETVRSIGARLSLVRDVRTLAKLARVDAEQSADWTKRIAFTWKRAPKRSGRRAVRKGA